MGKEEVVEIHSYTEEGVGSYTELEVVHIQCQQQLHM